MRLEESQGALCSFLPGGYSLALVVGSRDGVKCPGMCLLDRVDRCVGRSDGGYWGESGGEDQDCKWRVGHGAH